MTEFQNFLEEHPNSSYREEVQRLIFDLQDVLVEKEYLSAKLYYDLGSYFMNCSNGGSNYQACIITAQNAILDYPYTKRREDLSFLILKAKFELAEKSVESKKEERYRGAIDEYYGFTDEEVKKICDDYQMSQKFEVIKEWYNGYLFGDANVYNPWSVIRFIKDLKADENEFPSSYWANTSSNSIVRKLIDVADEDTKAEIEELIEGKTIEKPVHEDITYDEIYKSMDNLWNFMFFTGYFRKVGERMDDRTKQIYVELTIPNEEVKYIFRTKVLGWFDEKVKARDRSKLFTALVNLDVETVEEEVVDMLLETISFNDAYESFYHGFLAGILSGMKGYIVKSNREGGTGRSDLFVKPVTRRKPAYVLEFKVADKFNQLDKAADEALAQIEDRGYVKELEDDGYATVYRYGIAFCGKDCMVKLADVEN